MSKEAMKWAEQQQISDGTVMSVLRAVAWYSDKGTGECRRSIEDLAERCRLKSRAVRYSLDILERLEIVSRTARSKGKYGRTTDLISLPLDRSFDVSKAAVKAVRIAARTHVQAAHGATSKKSCKRHDVPLQAAHGATQYNTVDTEEPYHGEDSLSVPNEGTYTRGEPAEEFQATLIHDRTNTDGPTGNVVMFRARAAQ